MCGLRQSSVVDFFDSIAPKWDSWEDLESLNVKFSDGFKKFGLKDNEHVLDVGCGTGNLTAALLCHLSQSGRVAAIDVSSKMIEIAQTKVQDSRVQWICNAVEHMDAFISVFDRIICYSVWPHLTDTQTVGRLFWKLLKPDGKLHIWHLISRDKVNKIHAEASTAVNNHLLAPAEQTAALLATMGFSIQETLDNETGYLVTACKV